MASGYHCGLLGADAAYLSNVLIRQIYYLLYYLPVIWFGGIGVWNSETQKELCYLNMLYGKFSHL